MFNFHEEMNKLLLGLLIGSIRDCNFLFQVHNLSINIIINTLINNQESGYGLPLSSTRLYPPHSWADVQRQDVLALHMGLFGYNLVFVIIAVQNCSD